MTITLQSTLDLARRSLPRAFSNTQIKCFFSPNLWPKDICKPIGPTSRTVAFFYPQSSLGPSRNVYQMPLRTSAPEDPAQPLNILAWHETMVRAAQQPCLITLIQHFDTSQSVWIPQSKTSQSIQPLTTLGPSKSPAPTSSAHNVLTGKYCPALNEK